MEVINAVLTVIFVFVSFILVIFILLQNNRSSGASLFGGGSQSAFGSSSADALTKITAALVATFVILALILAFLRSRATNIDDLKKELGSSSQQELMAPELEPALQENPAGNESKQK